MHYSFEFYSKIDVNTGNFAVTDMNKRPHCIYMQCQNNAFFSTVVMTTIVRILYHFFFSKLIELDLRHFLPRSLVLVCFCLCLSGTLNSRCNSYGRVPFNFTSNSEVDNEGIGITQRLCHLNKYS